MPLQYHEEPRVWAETHFMGAEMSDVRRTHRVVTIAEAMAASPGCSIPQMFAHAYDIKAAYNLFHHPESTPDHLQAGHQDMVREQMYRPGVYLLVEDTTTMSWSGKKAIPGLGQISNGAAGLQGFLLHSVLTVRWPEEAIGSGQDRRPAVEVIGLGDQQHYVRQRRATGQPRESSQARKYRKRESHIWEQAGQRIGPTPQGVRWIRIGDREADIYEHLRACQQLGHGFVIRAAKDRGLIDPQSGKRAGRLFALVRRSKSLGTCELEWRSRADKPARMATLQLSATPVE
jgi:Transposase DNA-binding